MRPLVSGQPRRSGVSCASARAIPDGVGDGVGCDAPALPDAVGVLLALADVLFDSSAFPMNPPMSPDITAMRSAPMRRIGQRVQRFCDGGEAGGCSFA